LPAEMPALPGTDDRESVIGNWPLRLSKAFFFPDLIPLKLELYLFFGVSLTS
jgi:hypothetical protein